MILKFWIELLSPKVCYFSKPKKQSVVNPSPAPSPAAPIRQSTKASSAPEIVDPFTERLVERKKRIAATSPSGDQSQSTSTLGTGI